MWIKAVHFNWWVKVYLFALFTTQINMGLFTPFPKVNHPTLQLFEPFAYWDFCSHPILLNSHMSFTISRSHKWLFLNFFFSSFKSFLMNFPFFYLYCKTQSSIALNCKKKKNCVRLIDKKLHRRCWNLSLYHNFGLFYKKIHEIIT